MSCSWWSYSRSCEISGVLEVAVGIPALAQIKAPWIKDVNGTNLAPTAAARFPTGMARFPMAPTRTARFPTDPTGRSQMAAISPTAPTGRSQTAAISPTAPTSNGDILMFWGFRAIRDLCLMGVLYVMLHDKLNKDRFRRGFKDGRFRMRDFFKCRYKTWF